jgi:pyruvate formate lyase activating enzyme
VEKAVIFNIMRYSIHDGPGIRTTVFFKGCPLSCKWCHNPESIGSTPETTFNETKCIKCGRCEKKNQPYAFGTDICPTGARETIGYEITAAELMKEINKDSPFYEESGGGVTFSGGEPFYQADFLLELLSQCRENYVNTAIDTSGCCNTTILLNAAAITNYFLYDIKFIDSKKHEKYCGAANELILENLKNLEETKTKLLIRIPVIPGINDDMEEMTGIFEFIKDMKNIEAVHLLPYHNIHIEKYKRLGKQYELVEIPNDESPNMKRINDLFSNKFMTKVGG